MEYLLTTDSLTKIYHGKPAVNRVSMNISKGEIYGLIGRNGAGKTTLMKMICGLAAPSAGDFTLFGKRGAERVKMMRRVGALIEAPGIYANLSAADNIHIKALAFGVKNSAQKEKELLELVGLGGVGKKSAGKFSLGMRQRLGIAMALVADPELLILDEPINGLDPQGIAEVRDVLHRLNAERGITIIISSHILEELAKVATSFGIINNGVMIEELTREQLMAKCSSHIDISVSDINKAADVLQDMGFNNFRLVGENTIGIFERTDESAQITLAMAKAGLWVYSICTHSEALEDYFLRITGGVGNV